MIVINLFKTLNGFLWKQNPFLACSNSMIKIYSLNDVNDDKLNQFNGYICDRIR